MWAIWRPIAAGASPIGCHLAPSSVVPQFAILEASLAPEGSGKIFDSEEESCLRDFGLF